MGTIKIMVVDDSLVYRTFLTKRLSEDPGFEVIATASGAYEAMEKLTRLNPDVITLDLEMPGMNGIEFLKQHRQNGGPPVIVISSANERVFEAIHAGAVDFVAKLDMQISPDTESFIADLKAKIKIARIANLLQEKRSLPSAFAPKPSRTRNLISIGASTGGTEAILDILKALPQDMPGILVVQHMPPGFTKMYAKRLDSLLPFHVDEAKDRDLVAPRTVLIAPGDKQMAVYKSGGSYRVKCYPGEKVSGHCPSVDVLFESVAKEAGSDAVGVLLTGMGSDGAKGLLSMRTRGAKTIGQNRESSLVYGMPKVAFEIGAVTQQAPLDEIPQLICSFLSQT